jgi:hypothetical protein
MPSLAKAPTPGSYRAAQLLARSRAGALTQEAAQRVVAAIHKYADTLVARVADLPAGTPAARQLALTAAAKIAKDSANSVTAELTKAIAQKRNLAFRDVYSLWNDAGKKAAKALNVPDALLGAVETPSLTMAGTFEALGGVPFLKSLSASGKAAGAEVATILREGLTGNVGPDELARRLRPYVAGSEVFEKAFPKADERFKAMHTARAKLPPDLRGAASRMRSNSLRIAYSEVHNARAEAELQAFALDPLVGAIRWELSPFRGSQADPDPCDAFAVNDWYGLGKGVYPLDAVPLPPHPRDRCERIPVMRPPEEWSQPKPRGLKRKLKPSNASLGANAGQLTALEGKRIRDVVRGQLQQLDQHSSPAAIRKLMDYGEGAAGELLEIASARQALLAELALAAESAEAAAAAAAAEPTTIGLVTFPTKLEGDALGAAKELYAKAAKKSTAAMKALKEAGADTSALEAKIAAQKAAAQAKKAAKAVPPVPTPVAPPAPVPVAPAPSLAQVKNLQETLKSEGVYLLTKEQIADNFDTIVQAISDLNTGSPTAAIATLKKVGANTAKLEKKLGVAPLPVPKPVPAPPIAPPVAPPVPAAPPPTASAANVLHQKIGEQAGTNPGGFYLGQDGVKRYVKVYADPSQAYSEHMANELYRRLGIGAPESLTFVHDGKVYYASRLISTEGNQTLGALGVTQDRARKALEGFAADVLTGNWDAPGLGFDNLIDVGGKIVRVDNGSAFLFRAQGKRKAANLLEQITEWEGFAPGAKNLNAQYAELFTKAGFNSPDDLGAALVEQIDRILQLEKNVGSWAQFLSNVVPDMKVADRDAVYHMLKARTALLKQKRDAIAATLTKHTPLPAPITAPPAPIADLFKVDSAQLAQSLNKLQTAGTLKIAKSLGITVTKDAIAESKLGLAFLKQHVVKAAQGNDNSIAILQYHFKADVAALQKKLGKVPLSVPATTPAAPVAPNVPPHVPAGPLIKPSEVPGVQATSKVQQPFYFNASNTTASSLKAVGVDFTKVPVSEMGFALSAEKLPLASVQKHTLKAHIVAKNPVQLFAATDADIDKSLNSLVKGYNLSASPSAKRQLLLDQGIDALVITGTDGKVRKVIALRSDVVKFVDETVTPVKPTTPQVGASTGQTYSGQPTSSLPAGKPDTPAGYVRDSDAQRELDRLHANAASQLTDAERRAVTHYTGSGYAKLNPELRSGGTLTPTGKTLQKAIDNSPRITNPVVLYRGLGYNHPYKKLLDKEGFAGLQKLVDEVQHDLAFMSTSTSQQTAVHFGGTGIILELRLPAGTRGFWARLHGSHRSENEMILSARQEYRILEVREEQGGYGNPRVRIIVEVIP